MCQRDQAELHFPDFPSLTFPVRVGHREILLGVWEGGRATVAILWLTHGIACLLCLPLGSSFSFSGSQARVSFMPKGPSFCRSPHHHAQRQ